MTVTESGKTRGEAVWGWQWVDIGLRTPTVCRYLPGVHGGAL